MSKREPKDGEYFIGMSRGRYLIYQCHHSGTPGSYSGSKIEEHRTFEEARSRLYELNGWRKPEHWK